MRRSKLLDTKDYASYSTVMLFQVKKLFPYFKRNAGAS